MKKNLLLLLAILLGCATMMAFTDGQTYEPENDYKLVNQWIYSRVHTPSVFKDMKICNTRARTAVLCGDVVYVAHSEAVQAVTTPGDTVAQSVIYRFDVKTGEELPTLYVTLDGKPYGAFLGVTSIGKDNFGHLWVAPMTSNTKTFVPFYELNGETGELRHIADLDKGDAVERTDYLDVVGDIRFEQAECNVMTIGGASADPGSSTCYRWHCDQGETDLEGGFDGDTYINFTTFYPETKVGFSLAPVVKMLLGETDDDLYAGELFYIDCFDTAPVLYDISGSVIDTFEEVDNSLQPQRQANGMCEFRLDERPMFVYTIAQYDGTGHGCQANITELGEGMSLGGMTKYWQIPADSLGKVSDTGLRIHCLNAEVGEENGEQVATILTYKCYNGIAVYKMGKNVGGGDTPLKGDVNGDGVVNVADVSALVNIILEGGSASVADINEDGAVNVSDVSALVNIILAN